MDIFKTEAYNAGNMKIVFVFSYKKNISLEERRKYLRKINKTSYDFTSEYHFFLFINEVV